MKYKCALFVIIILIAVPAIHAADSSDWGEITVDKVKFQVPGKYFNESDTDENSHYYYGYPYQFKIISLKTYNNLKKCYGMDSTSDYMIDLDQEDIAGHHTVIIKEYNHYYDRYELFVYFVTGNKIFFIEYHKGNVTKELVKIIKSTPKSKMSEEKFLDKLDGAQKGYLEEDYQKNLELDMEDFYQRYNDQHQPKNHFVSVGDNGWTFGHMY